MTPPMFRAALLAIALTMAPAAAQRWASGETSPVGVDARREIVPFPDAQRIARGAAGGGDALGGDLDLRQLVYRFKFIREGRVTWVDLDARSGAVLRVEGR